MVDIWRGFRLVRFKPWLFLIGAMVGFLMVLVGPSLTTKPPQIYKSTAKVLITPNTTSVADGGQRSVDSTVRTWFTDENTIRALLSSQDLLDVVLEASGSKLSWLEFRDRVQVEILSNSGQAVSLLELSVLGNKPEEVRILTQILSEKFIQYVQQLSASEHDKTVAFLERERRNAEREVARAHKRLLKIGILPASAGGNSFEQAWVNATQRRSELEQQAAMAEAEVDQLEIAATEGLETTGLREGAGTAVLDDSVSKERLKLAELRETFTERSPQVKEQLGRLRRAEEVQRVEFARSVDARRKASVSKQNRLRSLLAQTEQRLKALEAKRPGPEKYLQYSTEERQLSMWQDSYLDLTKQLYRARVMQQSSRREGAFTIVEKPQPGALISGQIVARSMIARIALAIPVGLLVGLAFVMASDYLSTSMRLEPRIEEALGLPIIGTIPTAPDETIMDWDTMKRNVRKPQAPV